jgi:hypothetical protein
MAVTRTIKGTLDRLVVNAGTEITYLGPTASGDRGDLIRGFRVSPAGTGNIIVNIDRSNNLVDISIFQEDNFNGSSAPTGYLRYFNVVKAGKEKGAVAAAVTNATKKYIVLLKFDNYSDASYSGNVTIP